MRSMDKKSVVQNSPNMSRKRSVSKDFNANSSFYQCHPCSVKCHNSCMCRCHFPSCEECDEGNCNISKCPHDCHKDEESDQMINIQPNQTSRSRSKSPMKSALKKNSQTNLNNSQMNMNNSQINNSQNYNDNMSNSSYNNMKSSGMYSNMGNNNMQGNMNHNMNNNMQGNMNNNMKGNKNNNMYNNMNNNMQGNMNNNMQGNMYNNMQGNMYNNMQGNMNNNIQGNMNNNFQGNNNMQGNNRNNNMNNSYVSQGKMGNNQQMNNSSMRNMNSTMDTYSTDRNERLSPTKKFAKKMVQSGQKAIQNNQNTFLGNLIQIQNEQSNLQKATNPNLKNNRRSMSTISNFQANNSYYPDEEENYVYDNDGYHKANDNMSGMSPIRRRMTNMTQMDQSVNLGLSQLSLNMRRFNPQDERDFIKKLEIKTRKEKESLKTSLQGRKQLSKYSPIVLGEHFTEDEKMSNGLISDFKKEMDNSMNTTMNNNTTMNRTKQMNSTMTKKTDDEIFTWKTKSKNRIELEEKAIEQDFDISTQEEVPQGQKKNLSNNLQRQFDRNKITLPDPDKLENYRNEKFVRDKSTIARDAEFLNREIKMEKVNDKTKLANSIFADIEKQESWQSYTTLLFADTEVKGVNKALTK